MTAFPVRYDPATNTINLDGPGGASVMLGLLLKAKFGEAFDPAVLFHQPLAEIMRDLWQASLTPQSKSTGGSFSIEHLQVFAQSVLDHPNRSGWPDKSEDQKVAYLREVVAAPHPLSDGEVELLLDAIRSGRPTPTDD